MPALTRRRSYNSHHETWHLYFASTVETVQDGRIHN
jgi:hypothetical protein